MILTLPTPIRLTPILVITVLFCGCRRGTVSYYEVPREESLRQAAAPAADQGDQELHWHMPLDWTESAGSAMRLSSYSYTSDTGELVDISVTRFPDAAGGVLANINRWRDQAGLPPIADADLASETKRIPIAGKPALLVDFSGRDEAGQPMRITGAIVSHGGASWFFKMTGNEAVVASQYENFLSLLNSVHEGGHPSEETAAGPPGPTRMEDMAVPTSGGNRDIDFEIPTGWVSQGTSSIRAASFLIETPGTPAAEVSVTAFPGDVGGDLANVNRWRGQLRLPPIDDATLGEITREFEGSSHTFRIFDLESEALTVEGGRRSRILAAVVEQGDSTWFVKMFGESELVAGEHENFELFLNSLKINTAK